jgi:amidophosphoribosyltransferase
MCGIYAIFSNQCNNDNVSELLSGMKKLQHRGKEGFGISTVHSSKNLIQYKSEGLINKETTFLIKNIKSYSCLGHIRYATSGNSIKNGKINENEIQPLFGSFNNFSYFLAHDGNVPNIEGHDTTFLNKQIMDNNQKSLQDVLISLLDTIQQLTI